MLLHVLLAEAAKEEEEEGAKVELVDASNDDMAYFI